MPFVFNALKINSTLALIGAIVAEFFGTPIVGMGFRISTEAARLNMGLVCQRLGDKLVEIGVDAGCGLGQRWRRKGEQHRTCRGHQDEKPPHLPSLLSSPA
jgi:hypothetical protein